MWLNNMRGVVPEALKALTGLSYLRLGVNDFSGSSLPEWISALTGLTLLNFDDSNLTGPIPHGISALTRVTGLALWNNRLTGIVPSLPFKQYVEGCLIQNPHGINPTGNDFTCPLPKVGKHVVENMFLSSPHPHHT
jgi:hypothetical protein